MARAPNKKVDEAYELYKKGYKLVDIAKELDMAESTIRVWKNRYKWGGENEMFQKDKRNVSNKKANRKKVNKEPVAVEVKEVLENTELTDKQKLFCIYYIEDFNKTKAYQKAYACSYDTARVEGCKCLTKPNIKKEVERLTAECLEEQEINSKLLNKRLLEMYIKIAFSDISDYLSFGQEEQKVWGMDDDGKYYPVIDPDTGEQRIRKYNVVNLNESIEFDTSIISEVSEGKDGVKIKLQDKMKAMDFLSKNYDLLNDNDKTKLDMEYAILRNEKLKIETDKLKGNKDVAPIKIEFVKASEKNEQGGNDK